MEDKEFTPPPRQCEGCTACCEGWLSGEALGKRFFPGQPCHWMSCNGCTIYEDRPSLCTDFSCAWISNHFLPEWFKPTESNAITRWQTWKDIDECTPEDRGGVYLVVLETGGKIKHNCMTWLTNYASAGMLNVKYQLEGRWHWMGSDSFTQWCANGSAAAAKPQ